MYTYTYHCAQNFYRYNVYQSCYICTNSPHYYSSRRELDMRVLRLQQYNNIGLCSVPNKLTS